MIAGSHCLCRRSALPLRWSIAAAALTLVAFADTALAQPQGAQTVRIRGMITTIDAGQLSLKARDGTDLSIRLTAKTTVATTRAITLADLKPDVLVGAVAVKGADGVLVARELRTIPKTARQGHSEWDLEPGASMTNAYIESAVKVGSAQEITMTYQGGSQRIRVPPGTPIVTTDPADRSALAPGVYVFLVAEVAADNALTALRIQASKDGVKPAQ